MTTCPRRLRSGALAVVVEHELPGLEVPQLVVGRCRDALADAADAWYDHPSRRLHVIGITGTDGKTTTAFLAEAMLRAGGWRPGLVGTVEVGIGDERAANENRNTTPEALELQALLADMVAAGNDSVVMEATSHGLAQARTRNVDFDIGILTNLTSEHLEFHGSWENYRGAKAMLFQQVPMSILNADDPSVAYFHAIAGGRVVTYGLDNEADVRASDVDARANGTSFTVTTAEWSGRVELQLPGSFNVHNALAVMALAKVEGIEPGPGGARAGGRARRAGSDGDGGPWPAVRCGRRLRAHRRFAGQGAAHPAPAGHRPGDRRLRLGGGARPDQATGHGAGQRRAGGRHHRHRRGSPSRGSARSSTRPSPRAPARPARGTARRCSSSTTARRRSATPSAWRRPAT